VTPRVRPCTCSEDSSNDAGEVSTKPGSKHRNSRRDSSQSELHCGVHDDMKPDSKRRRTTAGERCYDGGRHKMDHHCSQKVSFYDATSSSESESDESSQRKHFMKEDQNLMEVACRLKLSVLSFRYVRSIIAGVDPSS